MRADIKRFILKALLKFNGTPLLDQRIKDLARQAIVPAPPVTEIEIAINELSNDGFISGHLDEMDNSVTYHLTTRGYHKASQLP